jgi:hypothetical protein
VLGWALFLEQLLQSAIFNLKNKLYILILRIEIFCAAVYRALQPLILIKQRA